MVVFLFLAIAGLLYVASSRDVNQDILDNFKAYADTAGLNGLLESRPGQLENIIIDDPENPGGFLGDTLELDRLEQRPPINHEDPDEDAEDSASGALEPQVEFQETPSVPQLPEKEYPAVPDPEQAKLKLKFAFRVYTHNIKNGVGASLSEGELPWEKRKMLVVALIKLHAVPNTIVALQEAHEFQLLDVMAQLNILDEKEWVAFSGGRTDGHKMGEMVPIIVRNSEWDVIFHDTFWLNENQPRQGLIGWDAMYPRIATYVTLKNKQSGAYLNVFNTHFDHKGKEARMRLAKLLMQKMGLNNWPSLLCGDLNILPNDKCYEQLSKTYSDVHRVASAYNKYGHPDFSVTGFLGNLLKNAKRSDYIFAPDYVLRASEKTCQVTPATPKLFYLQVTGYGLLHSKFGGLYMSDHRPVLADFAMGGCGGV